MSFREDDPVASLGMYDFPWLRTATDRLWAAIRDRMWMNGADAVPETLERDRGLEDIWRDPKLILAQTCGFPLVTELRDSVRVVATPCYDFPCCDGPLYCSVIVVRAENRVGDIGGLRGISVAINGWNSQSGMNALRAMVAPVAGGGPFFDEIIVSGSHLGSLAMVREGKADVAAIDCVTHGLVAGGNPDLLRGTRVLCRTPLVPGLPLIASATAPDATLARLIAALEAAMADPDLADARAVLHLRGIARLGFADYAPILAQRDAAEALGYPALL